MHKVYFGIGGNLGNKLENLKKCQELIKHQIGEIDSISSIYETPPWGFNASNTFYNQVLLAHTLLQAKEILLEIKKIEGCFQKKEVSENYTSREMDVDILFYNQAIIKSENLVVPHPHMHKRNFVLVPMVEIAKDFVHPIFGKSILELLNDCNDKSSVVKV